MKARRALPFFAALTLAGLCGLGWGAASPAYAEEPRGPELCVSDTAENTLDFMDKNNKLITQVPLGQKPIGDPKPLNNGTKVFQGLDNGTVAIINVDKHEKVGDVGLLGPVLSVAVSPDDSRVCVLSENPVTNSLELTVIDPSTDVVAKVVSLGNDLNGMDFCVGMDIGPDGTTHLLLMDTNRNGKLVAVSPSGKVERSIDVKGACSMTLSPDGQSVFLINSLDESKRPQLVRADANTYTPVGVSAPLDSTDIEDMKVSPNGKVLYFLDWRGGALYVVDVTSLTITKKVDVLGTPTSLDVSDDGNFIWVTVGRIIDKERETHLVTIDATTLSRTPSRFLTGGGASVAGIAGWQTAKLGNGDGSVNVDPKGVWTPRGTGTVPVGGTSDNGLLVHMVTNPPGSLSFRVHDVQGGDVGPQVRTNESADAANVFTRGFFNAEGFKVGKTFRTTNGGQTGFPGYIGEAPLGSTPAVWAQINGNEHASYASDGPLSLPEGRRNVWRPLGDPVALPQAPGPVLLGIALASATPGGTVTARLDQVRVQPGVLLPYRLKAVGSDRAVTLTWDPLPGVARYRVYRAPHGGAPNQFVLLQVVAGTSYRDTSQELRNGTTYDYAVAAEKSRPDGTPSAEDLVVFPGTPVGLPAGMFGCSIAEGTNSGSVTFDPQRDIYTLHGYGNGIQRNGDQCYFAGKMVEGNRQVYATLPNGLPAQNGATAGLVIRDTLCAGSPYAGILDHPTSGLVATWRSMTDGTTVGQVLLPKAQLTYPVQVGIARMGDRIWFGAAPNGKPFGWLTSVAQPPSGPTYAGMAITSNNRLKPAEAPFHAFGIR